MHSYTCYTTDAMRQYDRCYAPVLTFQYHTQYPKSDTCYAILQESASEILTESGIWCDTRH